MAADDMEGVVRDLRTARHACECSLAMLESIRRSDLSSETRAWYDCELAEVKTLLELITPDVLQRADPDELEGIVAQLISSPESVTLH